jgi:hypothetical protein
MVDGAQRHIRYGGQQQTVQTTDATETTLDSVIIPNNTSAFLMGHVFGQRIGDATKIYSAKVYAVVNSFAGQATVQGAATPAAFVLDPGSTSFTATIDDGGGGSLAARLRVTGRVGETVRWFGSLEVLRAEANPFNLLSTEFTTGTTKLINFGDVLDWAWDAPRSYSWWVKTTAAVARPMIAKHGAGTPGGYNIYANNTGTLVATMQNVFPTEDLLVESALKLNNGAWRHLCITWSGVNHDASDMKMYFDGAIDAGAHAVRDNLTANPITAGNFVLGNYTSGAVNFVGKMDEVGVYDAELSAAEVVWVRNGGKPRSLNDTGGPAGLVAYWRMGDHDTFPDVVDHSGSGFDGVMENMSAGQFVADVPP